MKEWAHLLALGSSGCRDGDDVDVAVVAALLQQAQVPLKCNYFLALHQHHHIESAAGIPRASAVAVHHA